MAITTTKYSDFQSSKVQFSRVRKGKMGQKTISLLDENGKRLFVQLPWMRSPYGLSAYTDESTGRTSYSLDLSFDTDNEEAQVFRQKVAEIDELIVKQVAANSVEFTGKEMSEEVLKQALYKPMIREPRDEQYPATFKTKITVKPSGEFAPEAWTMKREQTTLDAISKGTRVCAIVEFSSIWVIDGKFGCTVRLSQCIIEESERLPSFAFVDVPGLPALAPAAENETDFISDEDLVDE